MSQHRNIPAKPQGSTEQFGYHYCDFDFKTLGELRCIAFGSFSCQFLFLSSVVELTQNKTSAGGHCAVRLQSCKKWTHHHGAWWFQVYSLCTVITTSIYHFLQGYVVAHLVEALCYKLEGRAFESRWCQGNFRLMYSFQPHCGPGFDSASYRNEYQEYLNDMIWYIC
jgi:hypothetical protein